MFYSVMPVTLLRPLCTRADVQQTTRNDDTDYDDIFDAAINLSSRFIEERCKRKFWYIDATSTPYTVLRGDVIEDGIYLPFPIQTLTQLATYDSDDTDEDIWESDAYWWENSGNGSVIRSAGGASRYVKHVATGGMFMPYPNSLGMKVKLTGTFGWGDAEAGVVPKTDIPAAVRRAAALVAAAFSEEMNKQEIGLDGSATELLDSKIPREAKTLLQGLRIRHRTVF